MPSQAIQERFGSLVRTPLRENELCPDPLLEDCERALSNDIARLLARRDEFVEVSCPVCTGPERTDALEKHGCTYVRCGRCRTIYMNPRPSPSLMHDYYAQSENFRLWARRVYPESDQARRTKLHQPRLDFLVRACREHAVAQDLLVEVGAGFGSFCDVAQRSGAFTSVIAVEPTPALAEHCRKLGLRVVAQRIEDVTDEIAGADCIVAFEVIEHLFSPRAFVQRCRDLLRPGGLLLISCPNGEGFDIAMLGRDSMAVDPGHVNLMNPCSLSLLAEECGLDVIEVSTPGRLDTDFVCRAIDQGIIAGPSDPFLRRVLVDERERLRWPFQQFLMEHGLSSHMWLLARRP